MFICSSNGKGEIILNYFLRESLVQVAQINNNWMLDNCNYFNKSVTIDGIRKYEQLSFLRQSHNFSLIFNSKSIILKELVFIKLWKYFMVLFWRNNKYLTIHLYFIRTAGTCMWFLFKIFTQFPLKDLSKFVWMWITLSTIVATGVWKIQLKCKEV